MSIRAIQVAAAAGTLAAAVAVSIAYADTHTLAQSADWVAFGGTTTSGVPVCGRSTQQGNKYFGIKDFSGSSTFDIQMGTSDWKVDDRLKVDVVMQFDSDTPWKATGTSFHFNDGDPGLEFGIKHEELDEFMRELGNSKVLHIKFPTQGWTDWNLSLGGANAVAAAVDNCIKNMK